MKKYLLLLLLLTSVAAYAGKPAKKTETVSFSVSMDCKNCVKKVTENISFEKGVKDLSAELSTKTVRIVYDPAKTDTTKLAEAIRRLGYKVKVQ